jgi:D-3-phosphoglycerate dehydrogenase
MLPYYDRFKPVFAHYGLEVIAPKVEERLEEEDILQYANQFDGTICGDDRYSRRVLEACLPRLKVVSKWEPASIRLTRLPAANWESN